jgi:hypothetical protein
MPLYTDRARKRIAILFHRGFPQRANYFPHFCRGIMLTGRSGAVIYAAQIEAAASRFAKDDRKIILAWSKDQTWSLRSGWNLEGCPSG